MSIINNTYNFTLTQLEDEMGHNFFENEREVIMDMVHDYLSVKYRGLFSEGMCSNPTSKHAYRERYSNKELLVKTAIYFFRIHCTRPNLEMLKTYDLNRVWEISRHILDKFDLL